MTDEHTGCNATAGKVLRTFKTFWFHQLRQPVFLLASRFIWRRYWYDITMKKINKCFQLWNMVLRNKREFSWLTTKVWLLMNAIYLKWKNCQHVFRQFYIQKDRQNHPNGEDQSAWNKIDKKQQLKKQFRCRDSDWIFSWKQRWWVVIEKANLTNEVRVAVAMTNQHFMQLK